MVAYNFQGCFAEAVERGEKCQTIRAQGKRHHARPGDNLQLYTGQRTKACRKLRVAVCHDVCPILIENDMVTIFHPPNDREIYSNWVLDPFARLDGFASWTEMRDWFAKVHGLPFTGILIRWLVPNP